MRDSFEETDRLSESMADSDGTISRSSVPDGLGGEQAGLLADRPAGSRGKTRVVAAMACCCRLAAVRAPAESPPVPLRRVLPLHTAMALDATAAGSGNAADWAR